MSPPPRPSLSARERQALERIAAHERHRDPAFAARLAGDPVDPADAGTADAGTADGDVAGPAVLVTPGRRDPERVVAVLGVTLAVAILLGLAAGGPAVLAVGAALLVGAVPVVLVTWARRPSASG